MGRLDLYLHFDRPLTPLELARFKPLLLRRAERAPLQYVIGRAAFRELELGVDERALIPRPETEELVEAVLTRVREWGREGLTALDVGTGTGAIALSLLKEGPFATVVATDSSGDALELARANAAALAPGASGLEFRQGDLLEVVREGERFDVVVSNPPYVSDAEHRELEPEVREYEPRSALVAEGDGMALLKRLVQDAPFVLAPGGLLALEVGVGQSDAVSRWIRGVAGLEAPVVLRDLAGRDRMVLVTRSGTVEGPEPRDRPVAGISRTKGEG
jgi:release factor glutamine methyltransferase